MSSTDLSSSFGFLVTDVARLFSRKFDRRSRERLGMSRAQCRLLAVLVRTRKPLNQVELADQLEMTPMGVAKLCERMEAAGWIRREASATDGRAKVLFLQPSAAPVFDLALQLGEEVRNEALQGMSAAERKELVRLLKIAHANLVRTDEGAAG
jgi:DNA-binding MarR family transcriptional regulator